MWNLTHALITAAITSESDQLCLESRRMCAGVAANESPSRVLCVFSSCERRWCENQLAGDEEVSFTTPWEKNKTKQEHFTCLQCVDCNSASERNTTWETCSVVKSGFGWAAGSAEHVTESGKNNKHTGWLGKCQQQGQQFCVCDDYGRHLSPKFSCTLSLQWLDKSSLSFIVQFEISSSVHRCTKQGANFTASVKARQRSCRSTSCISVINSPKSREKILEVSPSKSPFFFLPFLRNTDSSVCCKSFFFFYTSINTWDKTLQ